jgi:hypothetical protein
MVAVAVRVLDASTLVIVRFEIVWRADPLIPACAVVAITAHIAAAAKLKILIENTFLIEKLTCKKLFVEKAN